MWLECFATFFATLGLALEDLGIGTDSSIELRVDLANLKIKRLKLTVSG
jgi:hypothetical protein